MSNSQVSIQPARDSSRYQLTDHTFATDDQEAFARLSGDYNPLHVDNVVARRQLFGEVVVHGVHTLLWAVEQWVRISNAEVVRFENLRAIFRRPVKLNQSVKYRIAKNDLTEIELEVTADDEVATWIRFKIGPQSKEGSTEKRSSLEC